MQKLLTNPLVLMRGVIAFLYVALGVYLLLNLDTLEFIGAEYRPFLAGVTLLYGLFRVYRFGIEFKALDRAEQK